MLVDSAVSPGPALWQWIMLCALPLLWMGMFCKNGVYIRWAIAAYAAFGVAVLIAIVRH